MTTCSSSKVGPTISTTKMLQDPAHVQALDINQIDKRSWATNYPLSKLQTALAAKLSGLTGVDQDRLFLSLERPKNDSFGHFSLPLPQLGLPNGTPTEHAKRLAEELSSAAPDVVSKAEAFGQFLNITTHPQKLMSDTLKVVLEMRENYGKTDIGTGKNILIDFCSCNIGKPFHAGHLRTTIIGNFIRNLFLSHGFHTLGMNYLGDWGKQFGLLTVGYKKYGNEEKLKEDANQHLYDVYVQINKDMETDPTIDEDARKYFVQMERGDKDALALWKRFRDLAVVNYKVTLARLGVIHDIYSGESFYEELMKYRIQELKDKKLMEESNGAFVVNLEQYKLGKPLILKSDGATLYLTRDIAAAQDRFETYNLDRSIYVVGCQQDLHFQQLFKICELMGKPWSHRLVHISYGMVRGMSTRKGTVVFLQDILDESKEVMLGVMKKNPAKYAEIENPEETADKLAVSAIIVQDLGSKRVKDYEFKMDRMTRFEGDTGPYLQYAHARTASIYRKYGNNVSHQELSQADFQSIE